MDRPSHREINRKLAQAKKAATGKRIAIVQQEAIYSDLLDLDILVGEFVETLPVILSEIKPDNYQGQRPPARSYQQSIHDCELFAFRWSSKIFGCQLYLKFALKKDMLWIVSFHRHRAKKGGRNP